MGQAVSVREGMELPAVVRELTQEKINRYAAVGGDHNPLHIDPEFAAKTPFGGTIAHGMLILAYVSEVMEEAFGERWATGGRLKVRLRGAARPGDRVTASGRVSRIRDGLAICEVECRNQQGEILVNGEADVRL